MIEYPDMPDAFTRAYVQAALWSSTDDDGTPLDASHGPTDILPATMAQMIADCATFQAHNAAAIRGRACQAGHHFWLTRNGHGAGFWDGDWPEPIASHLTNASTTFGEVDLIISED